MASPRRFWVVFVLIAALIGGMELRRWTNPETRAAALDGWLAGSPPDFLPYVPLFVLTPVFYGITRKRRVADASVASEAEGPEVRSLGVSIAASLLVAIGAFAVSVWFGRPLEGMPPTYHDEFSYLFQTETFAAGRTSFPSFQPKPELFDQMHVLNEGRFASRYFPGAALWDLPFYLIGHVWLAPHVAQAIVAFALFWAGRDLSGFGVGLTASVLAAVSPGLVIFSNTLLAHHPTLVGLSLFLVAITRFRRSLSPVAGLLAGIGLAYAMICRPMTAAGFALPWGIWFAVLLVTGWGASGSAPSSGGLPTGRLSIGRRMLLALALGGPLVAGMGGMLVYNRSITGSLLVSPYQLYTDIYTPRHVYGFNNVVRGEKKVGPKVLENYDRWAENLTPERAAQNFRVRIITSCQGTLGIVPIAFAVAWLLLSTKTASLDWWLVGMSILSLHAAHVPYWLDGIMGWHYVFESAPMLLLLFAEATRQIGELWRREAHPGMRGWWWALTGIAVVVNVVTVPSVWLGTIPRGMGELAFSRRRYAEVDRLFVVRTEGRRAVVFVVPDPADRHMDYVYNSPGLDGQILRARYRPEWENLEELVGLFPDRDAYQFVVKTGEMTLLRGSEAR